MFQSLIHLLAAVVLGVLAVLAARVWARDRRSYTLIVVVVAAGLTYDNAVLGLGRWIGHGDLLEALTWPRFVLHALTTPLLIIVGFGAARAFGARWARSRSWHAGFCALATFFVGWGVVTEVVGLQLQAETEAGIVSHGAAESSVPVPAIATIVVVLALGVVVWRAAGWPWLAVGAAVMFVGSGLGGVSALLTNIGELALIVSLVATEHESGLRARRWDAPRARSRRRAIARTG